MQHYVKIADKLRSSMENLSRSIFDKKFKDLKN